MPKVDLPDSEIVCVRHRDGWCATRKKTTNYQDHIKTVCGMVVTCPWEIELGDPDCPDCRRIMRLGEQDG